MRFKAVMNSKKTSKVTKDTFQLYISKAFLDPIKNMKFKIEIKDLLI